MIEHGLYEYAEFAVEEFAAEDDGTREDSLRILSYRAGSETFNRRTSLTTDDLSGQIDP